MNEPAIFYSKEGLDEAKELARRFADGEDGRWDGAGSVGGMADGDKLRSLANSPEDYRRFYHNIDGKKVRHDKVHNLYGFNMTRAAGEAFERIDPDRRFLMFFPFFLHRDAPLWRNLDGR